MTEVKRVWFRRTVTRCVHAGAHEGEVSGRSVLVSEPTAALELPDLFTALPGETSMRLVNRAAVLFLGTIFFGIWIKNEKGGECGEMEHSSRVQMDYLQ
jgi:hypothetical protein